MQITIGNFRNAIDAAIKEYETLFNNDNITSLKDDISENPYKKLEQASTKRMSSRRTLEIINIRKALSQDYQHIDDCTHQLETQIKKIKSGWWIFSKGHSRLCDEHLMPIINAYKTPLARSLLKQSEKHREQIDDQHAQLVKKEETIEKLTHELHQTQQMLTSFAMNHYSPQQEPPHLRKQTNGCSTTTANCPQNGTCPIELKNILGCPSLFTQDGYDDTTTNVNNHSEAGQAIIVPTPQV